MLEIYVSTDVETDGPAAGKHSILSIESAPTRRKAWWLTQPEARSACRQYVEFPRDAMARYVTRLESLPGKPVFVAYPPRSTFLSSIGISPSSSGRTRWSGSTPKRFATRPACACGTIRSPSNSS